MPAVSSSAEPELFGTEDSGAIEREAGGGRLLDRALAQELGEVQPDLAPVTTWYLRDLDRRPQLSGVEERDLVAAAKSGDEAARSQLIEAFLPLIASVARRYHNSGRVERLPPNRARPPKRSIPRRVDDPSA